MAMLGSSSIPGVGPVTDTSVPFGAEVANAMGTVPARTVMAVPATRTLTTIVLTNPAAVRPAGLPIETSWHELRQVREPQRREPTIRRHGRGRGACGDRSRPNRPDA